jgi:hypothetical protein
VWPGEDDENAQVLVADEAVVRAGRDEDGLPFDEWNGGAVDLERSAAFEDDVDLVVGVRLLLVWLWGDECVDAELEARRSWATSYPPVPATIRALIALRSMLPVLPIIDSPWTNAEGGRSRPRVGARVPLVSR